MNTLWVVEYEYSLDNIHYHLRVFEYIQLSSVLYFTLLERDSRFLWTFASAPYKFLWVPQDNETIKPFSEEKSFDIQMG